MKANPMTTKKKAAPKKVKNANRKVAPTETDQSDFWNLRLYVAGQTPKSLMAFANLKRLCEQHLANKYHIEVVDLMRDPQRAKTDQIVALPTLIRQLPEPIKRVIGDLSNTEKVQIGLDLQIR